MRKPIIGLFIIFLLLPLIIASVPDNRLAELAAKYEVKIKEVLTLTEANRQLTIENHRLKTKVDDYVLASRIVEYYKKHGGYIFKKADGTVEINHWPIDINHVRHVDDLIKKYVAMTGATRSGIDIYRFLHGWIKDQTNYNPLSVCTNNHTDKKTGKPYKSWDNYITQINTGTEPELLRLWPEYYPDMKAADVKRVDQVEYGIALICIWIADHDKKGSTWAYLGTKADAGWYWYWQIGEWKAQLAKGE